MKLLLVVQWGIIAMLLFAVLADSPDTVDRTALQEWQAQVRDSWQTQYEQLAYWLNRQQIFIEEAVDRRLKAQADAIQLILQTLRVPRTGGVVLSLKNSEGL